MADFTLLTIAGLGGLAIIVSKIVRRFVPEIVVFLALGVLIGPDGPIELINDTNIRGLQLLTEEALAAIIFLIGDRLRIDDLRARRRLLVPLNVVQLAATGLLVFLALQLLGVDVRVAAVLGVIAAETGVLTVTATMTEERAAGPFTEVALSSVAITNVAVAAVFGLLFPFVLATSGEAVSTTATVQVFAQIVLASCAIGLLGGVLLKTYGAAIESSGELLLFLLIVLTAMVGGAIVVDASVVITALTAGLYVANASPWLADRYFTAIRTIEAPIYLFFFVVAGADIHLDELATAGVVGGTYVVARAIGKVGGSTLGAMIGGGGATLGARTGGALLPHAGMAIALAAFVSEFAPALGARISPIVLGSIVVFELTGPLVTRWTLRASGEAGRADDIDAVPDVADGTRAIRRVLIPLGNTEVLVPRLPFLLDLVDNLGADVVALHVSQPTESAEGDEPEVLRVFREVAAERGVPCTTVHERGELIAQHVVDAAVAYGAGLVVMGEPARTSLLEPARWGLISQRVVRDSAVPVLVYPVDPSHPELAPRTALRRPYAADARDSASEVTGSSAAPPATARDTGE